MEPDDRAWLHARMAMLRGVENGFALVRSAHHGLLSVSDDRGRTVALRAAAPQGMSAVVAAVPLGSGPTLYTRLGDLFAWASVAATLIVAGLALRRGRAD